MSIAKFYDGLAEKHGVSAEGADASSMDALTRRYEVLTDVCDMNGKTVLEIGCGFGMLGDFLTKRYPEAKYRGIDISPGAVELGKKEYPHLDLAVGDLLMLNDGADIVLAQGIFYKLKQADMVTRYVIKMYELANEMVAFTFIDNLQDGTEMRPPPGYMVDYTGMGITPCFQLRHDYLPADSCMYLYKIGEGE